ncbi:tetraspanin family protein [Stylonychia lemnae]|uniref:Tetraspanin family protein n=1 Tax=Stylonychia lemnae TaxID=5949 RepID=A0A077ZYF7_STYLE|nr:tetraspanin family protein [Stylonychia lemnae]|eukprot:CDW73571.1 tetraspanin family protein [Stylonychia lemnae]
MTNPNQSYQEEMDYIKKVLYWGLMVSGAITILVGALGIFTARFKTCCMIGLFSFFSFIMSLIFLGIGVVIIIVSIASNQQIEQYCQNQTYDQFTINLSRYFLNYVEEYDKATSKLPNTYMCSYYCPCVPLDQSKWENYNITVGSPNQLYFTGQYQTFNQCYQDLIRDKRIQPINSKVLDFIKNLEDEEDCSGLCGAHKFWFYRSINNGPPSSNCQSGIQKQYNLTFGILGIGLLVTGNIVFMAFNAHYGLWRKRFTRSNSSRSNAYKVED